MNGAVLGAETGADHVQVAREKTVSFVNHRSINIVLHSGSQGVPEPISGVLDWRWGTCYKKLQKNCQHPHFGTVFGLKKVEYVEKRQKCPGLESNTWTSCTDGPQRSETYWISYFVASLWWQSVCWASSLQSPVQSILHILEQRSALNCPPNEFIVH